MATKKAILDRMKTHLLSNDQAALKGLLIIYSRQTGQEQNVGSTITTNGIGFRSSDARILSRIARHYQRHGKVSTAMMDTVKHRILHYTGQLFDNACEKGIYVRTAHKNFERQTFEQIVASKLGIKA